MRLESLYQEIILDHYRRPHHAGLREPFDAEVRHVNPVCGDEVTLRVTAIGCLPPEPPPVRLAGETPTGAALNAAYFRQAQAAAQLSDAY